MIRNWARQRPRQVAMGAGKSQLFRAGLSALWFSGAARFVGRWTAGKGAILMLHRVRPGPVPAFAPNARLCISPGYLRALLSSFRVADIDVIGLDEALARVHSPKRTRRFVCFTFDDAYRDNLEYALPVFRRFHAPFTVYATTSFADRALAPWWYALEYVIAREAAVHWLKERFVTSSLAAKRRAFGALSARFFELPVQQLRVQLQSFLTAHGRSMFELAQRDMCDWSELRTLQASGVEIGCHSVSHARLSHETEQSVHDELSSARCRIETELGQPVRHLAYPYGKREHVGRREFAIARQLGFTSAVTTRPGSLFAAHAVHRYALPRVEVTPSFEASPRYLHAILSGLPLIARNRGRRIVSD
jgi:peptidoglycan/xylan/chitin deacetylase (PgdA/CDA1 family)